MAAGYTLKEMMEYMGHADLQMVQRYVGDAGGGTRTPDTRIMIPLRFGSTTGFEGAGGPKRGQVRARVTRT